MSFFTPRSVLGIDIISLNVKWSRNKLFEYSVKIRRIKIMKIKCDNGSIWTSENFLNSGDFTFGWELPVVGFEKSLCVDGDLSSIRDTHQTHRLTATFRHASRYSHTHTYNFLKMKYQTDTDKHRHTHRHTQAHIQVLTHTPAQFPSSEVADRHRLTHTHTHTHNCLKVKYQLHTYTHTCT